VRTELGKIGSALQGVKSEQTRLQRETGRLVRLFAIAGLTLCALVVVLYGLLRGDWLNGLLAGIALAMSLLPEEFPVVLTVFLALGAWRIAQHHVLTRRMPAIETLGAATVLCVDKTGTLTENRMSVHQLFAKGTSYAVRESAQQTLPDEFHELVELAVLASQQDPFDPMEQALRGLGERFLSGTEHMPRNWTLLREYPLTPRLLAISHVWTSSQSEDAYVIAAKGSPEAIVDLCHLDESGKAAVFDQVGRMAGEGRTCIRGCQRALPADRLAAGRAARLLLRVCGTGRSGRPGASDRSRSHSGMLHCGHPRRHDHWRLSSHGPTDRAPDWPAPCRCLHYRARAGRDGR